MDAEKPQNRVGKIVKIIKMKNLALILLLLVTFSSPVFSSVKHEQKQAKAVYWTGSVTVLIYYYDAKTNNPFPGATVTLNGSAHGFTDANGELLMYADPGDYVGIYDPANNFIDSLQVPDTDIIFPGTFPGGQQD